MVLKPKEKIGVPEVVFGPMFGKSVIKQTFQNSRNRESYDFFCFDYKNGSRFALVFALTQNNEVIAIRQERHGADSVLIELPGGHREQNETLLDTAIREFSEETGFVPKTIMQMSREKIWAEPGAFTVSFDAFLARDCAKKESGQNCDPTEEIEVVLIPLMQWTKMVIGGEVTNAHAIATTFLAFFHLNILSLSLLDEYPPG